MSWTKFILAITASHCFLIMVAQAERLPVTTPLYQCPAYLYLDYKSYPLDVENQSVCDGPVEEMGWLVPEPVPGDNNPSFWDYGDYRDANGNPPERPLYLECHYKDTGHYLVLEMKGAYRCTFQKDAPVQCE